MGWFPLAAGGGLRADLQACKVWLDNARKIATLYVDHNLLVKDRRGAGLGLEDDIRHGVLINRQDLRLGLRLR